MRGRKPKYSPELIKKAQKMWMEGYNWRSIAVLLGFTSKNDVYYHANKKRHADHIKYMRNWYKNHRAERLIKMVAYNAKHRK